MALFQIPTPQEIRDQWFSEAQAQFPDTDPRLEKSLIGIIGKALSLAVHGMYVYLGFIARQIFASTAEAEYLDLHGTQLGLPRLEATKSTGTATATGVNGSVIPVGTQLSSGDDTFYQVLTEAVIAGGVAVLSLESVTFGASTNQAQSVQLIFTSPPSGVVSEAIVDTAGLTGGTDREADEPFRERIRFRRQNPIQCGTATDYIQWALEVNQVSRAFVYPNELGVGTVVVRFMTDSFTVDGIPTASKVTEVTDYITERMPVNVLLTVLAPVAVPVALNIQISPFTQPVIDAVTLEVNDLFFRDAQAGSGIQISRLREAVSNSTGEIDNIVTAPADNVTVANSAEILTVGVLTITAL